MGMPLGSERDPDAIGELPAIRGRVIQKLAGAIDELAKVDAEQLRAEHGRTLGRMREAEAGRWYAQAEVMPVLEAVAAQLGPEGYFEFHREGARRAMQGPLMKAVQDGSMRLYALQPWTLFTHTPALWHEALRNCGRFDPPRFVSEREVEMSLRDVPPTLEIPAFLEAARAQLAANFVICGCEGSVERGHGGDEGHGVGEPWVFTARW